MAKQVIKFWAGFCGPCKAYAPTFEKVKQELQSEQITFQEVDAEQDTEGLAGQYKVRSIPHTILLEDGEVKKSQSGRMGEIQLREFILN